MNFEVFEHSSISQISQNNWLKIRITIDIFRKKNYLCF